MNATKRKTDIFEQVTARILEALEQGVAPWTKPWTVAGTEPTNAATKKPYRGVNRVLLGLAGFGSPFWMTYKQAKKLGGHVRKGEKATTVVFWRFIEKEERDPETGEVEKKRIPFLRYYSVFNAEQCELPEGALPTIGERKEHDRIVEAEAIVDNMPHRPSIQHGGGRAFYRPTTDTVHVPDLGQFATADHYYSTLFHELVHATGSKNRLNRPGIAEFDYFGSHQYSDEELVAEFGAAFLCGHAGIENTVEHSAAYISHWAERLRDPKNKKVVVYAAARAQKAVDFILGYDPTKEEEADD